MRLRNLHKYPFRGAHPRSFKAKLWRRIRKESFCATQRELDAVKKKALLRGNLRSWFHWRNITVEDLHDNSGRFLRRCYDKIILYPMFEMAGHHVKFLEKQLYLYNGSDIPLPYDEDKIHIAKWLTRCIRSIVIAKPPYQPIYL